MIIQNRYRIFTLVLSLILLGCGSRFSPYLLESWSENYALASAGTKASPPEINDGKIETWGVTQPPDRQFSIILPEEKKINRIVVYSGNVISYELFCWDSRTNKWVSIGNVGRAKGRQRVYSDQYQLKVPRFDHRVNVKTDKIRLIVNRTEKDGVVTTRTPSKNDRIINHRVEYIQIGRDRVRVDLYDVFMFSPAAIREIEVYSQLEKRE